MSFNHIEIARNSMSIVTLSRMAQTIIKEGLIDDDHDSQITMELISNPNLPFVNACDLVQFWRLKDRNRYEFAQLLCSRSDVTQEVLDEWSAYGDIEVRTLVATKTTNFETLDKLLGDREIEVKTAAQNNNVFTKCWIDSEYN